MVARLGTTGPWGATTPARLFRLKPSPTGGRWPAGPDEGASPASSVGAHLCARPAPAFPLGCPRGRACAAVTTLPCRGGYHPPAICPGKSLTVCRGGSQTRPSQGRYLPRPQGRPVVARPREAPASGGPAFFPKESGEKERAWRTSSVLAPSLRELSAKLTEGVVPGQMPLTEKLPPPPSGAPPSKREAKEGQLRIHWRVWPVRLLDTSASADVFKFCTAIDAGHPRRGSAGKDTRPRMGALDAPAVYAV